MINIQPVIMCGGSGTRLWPLSRSHAPKQLQTFFGGKSLLTHTASRLDRDPNCGPVNVICSERYADEVADQLTSRDIKVGAILEEPIGRDTAAAAAISAQWVHEMHGPEAVMVLLPADHYVGDVDGFSAALLEAARAASEGYVSTIGIKPSRPETGYGYIRRKSEKIDGLDCYAIDAFVEKPDAATAQQYLEGGNHFWNSGIYAMRADTMLSELEKFEKQIFDASEAAYIGADRTHVDSIPRIAFKQEQFEAIPKLSLDYAVSERTDKGAVHLADFNWNDVGGWVSLRDLAETDEAGNVVRGQVYLNETTGSLIQADDRIVAVIGLDDVTVVDTPDALLVCSNSAAQNVKKIHAALVADGHSSAFHHAMDAKAMTVRQSEWAENWLFNNVLPLWAKDGIDRQFGGSIEGFAPDGRPMVDVNKRCRVQSRQAYVFAEACAMGWREGGQIMERLLDFMVKNYHAGNGGYITLAKANGDAADETIEAYDQAFAILAFGWAFHITGDTKYRQMAYQTLDFLNQNMRHEQGGYIDSLPNRELRRANPHMHLFEAAIHWMVLHEDDRMAELAAEMFSLYKSHFCVDGLLREYFNQDLSLVDLPINAPESLVEPGHLYEWAWLLKTYENITGAQSSTAAVLQAFADNFGFSRATSLVVDQIDIQGRKPEQQTSRLWPQTEFVRLKLGQMDPSSRLRGLNMLERIKHHYLIGDTGRWRDRVDADGVVTAHHAPASSLYHLLGCVKPLLKKREAIAAGYLASLKTGVEEGAQ